MTILEQLRESKWKYDNKLVNGIIVSNRKRFGQVTPKSRYILFMMMRRPVEWGIGRFVNKRNLSGLDLSYHSDEDIAMELYVLFDHCVDLFDLNKNDNLSLYFRSSIQRKVDKIIYSKSSTEVCYTGYLGSMHTVSNDEQADEDKLELFEDFSSGDYDQFYDEVERIGFTEEEKRFIHSKVANRKMTDVMSELELNRAQYKERLSIIAGKFVDNGFQL